MSTDSNRSALDEGDLRRTLVRTDRDEDPTRFWRRLDVVSETGSTNADLLARVASAESAEWETDRHVLVAEFQGSGRGRHSRTWVSPPRAQIAVSVALCMPGMGLDRLGWLPLMTGVAVVDALREVAGVPAELKWPNDILIGGRKVAGILAEVAQVGPEPIVVVGIGLNVSLVEDELPVPTATSLLLENASTTDRTVLVSAMLDRIAERWTQWHDSAWSVAGVAESYRQCCGTLGRRVRAELPGDKELLGTATDVDAQGRIVISPDTGAEPIAVSAADITHLRAVTR
ncbi:MAG: biotin--[acetyl-CoA-carboxylase] ligase [Rhodococcus sp.]|nr:biotin--[acetyl-CoA-carboxylase] ligase [Rhodococcus sp. (in: high G+C Gram-positive bacteria)]